MRKVIYLYYLIAYNAEDFSYENTHKYYSVDGSRYIKNSNWEQIWLFGAACNITKDFRICATKSRDKHIKKIY